MKCLKSRLKAAFKVLPFLLRAARTLSALVRHHINGRLRSELQLATSNKFRLACYVTHKALLWR